MRFADSSGRLVVAALVLLGGAVGIMVVSSLARRPMHPSVVTGATTLTGLAALSVSLVQWYDVVHHHGHVAVASAVVEDGFSALVSVLVSCAVVLAALVGDTWMRRERVVGPEFGVLILLSASGAAVMGAANDLIIVFLGLEILSIPLYVLAAMNARRVESGEAGLKYFLLGSFSSAVFLYGIALVYGATGTTNLSQMADYLARNVLLHNGLLLAGMALLLAGFGFKVAAVPFHLWTPDVYQGAPSPVTGFMAAVAKAGGFAALLRVFVSSFGDLRSDWQPVVWVLAAVTLVLGAVVALVQGDVKRLLAYSSINHAGFVLLGLQAATARGIEASLYYLFVYMVMVIGSFAVVTVVSGRGDTRHDLEYYRGLAARHPWLAGSFAVLLVSQAGVPFTTGFLAKLEVVSASVGAGSTALAVIAMVTAAIAGFFYLRVVLLMYAAPAEVGTGASGYGDDGELALAGAGTGSSSMTMSADGENGTARLGGTLTLSLARTPISSWEVPEAAAAVAIALCVGVTVLFGLWPAPLTGFAHLARLIIP